MLTLTNIKKSVSQHTDVVLFRNISLQLRVGEWVSIVGPSGAGKTTLLNCIAGIQGGDQGSIELDGMEIHQLTNDERSNVRRLHIGFVFQDFKLLPYYSVLENVILPLARDKKKEQLTAKAKSLLEQVGIGEGYYHRLPSALSGGEKQRVAIARALINDPKLIICDEPTGNLDNDNKGQVLHILHTLKQKEHAIIVVTHDEEVAREGDRIYELKNHSLNEVGVKDVRDKLEENS
ncbi:ABC-type lipoprotein export system ATPase subunit [Natronobacillus azotifigens]|uniref:ABC transporter ATP-binding protein n=1 Tax=Natronobacillus azotifigens TaxID=472978 RepID=A0A9J6RE10_9BACI|nr:ABC transporter ATP-binding protein [Natronobacillus azotifigens]MCZ0703433.1 ABC transporter ATP-binding protein [Natronobacillus azotifigens]